MQNTVTRAQRFISVVALILLTGFNQTGWSQVGGPAAESPVAKDRSGVAIGGHDTVAYHELVQAPQESAVGGDESFVVEYKGAKWRFLNQESAELFAANPEKYEPAYNGHCANALSLGKGLVKTNGKHWEILDDKLYLFYAGKGRDRWTDGNWEEYKVKSDAAWAELSK